MTARFSSHDDDGNDKLGPIVIWIATHPSTTTAQNAYDVSPFILSPLRVHGVEGAVTECFEGAVEEPVSLPLLCVTPDTDPTHYHRCFLTTALGMPVTTEEMAAKDAQGSVSFFFHEKKDKDGDTSDRVLAVSSCYVLRNDTNIDYEFKAADASRKIVRLAGHCQFQRAIDEIKVSTSRLGTDADLLAREIVEMEQELEAMPISVDVNNGRYTFDIGTFELNEARFRPNFAGNIVDLGAFRSFSFLIVTSSNKTTLGTKYTPGELTDNIYPRNNRRTNFKSTAQRKLRINGCVTREPLTNPDCFDGNNVLCLFISRSLRLIALVDGLGLGGLVDSSRQSL